MTHLIVCVGTTNESKLIGVKLALRRFFTDFEVIPCKVSSGVPPQPKGLSEIVKGATNRALNALKSRDECSLGIGVEAGMFKLISNLYFDVQVAAIADKNNWVTYGLSPSFQIPPRFAEELISGTAKELEEVVDKYFRTKEIGSKGGLIKLLSKSAVLREELTYYAVLMALLPRINREVYIK